jgi:hypothetical protein
MFQPIKVALGEYLGAWYAALSATTRGLHEFKQRGFARCFAWCPGRMVDADADMLAAWQRNNTDGPVTLPYRLPVVLVAMAKDYVPAARDYTRQMADRRVVQIPDDPKGRLFGLRVLAADIRTQIGIFAQDEPTARSLAAQFCLFIDSPSARTLFARHPFAGLELEWPVQLETSDAPAMSVAVDAKNLTVLAVDLTLKCHVPLFDHPLDDEPNDGLGTPGNPDDPSGYPALSVVTLNDYSDMTRPPVTRVLQ